MGFYDTSLHIPSTAIHSFFHFFWTLQGLLWEAQNMGHGQIPGTISHFLQFILNRCGSGLPFPLVIAVASNNPSLFVRVHSDGAGCARPLTGSALYTLCLALKILSSEYIRPL
jgi:hypothetical protein